MASKKEIEAASLAVLKIRWRGAVTVPAASTLREVRAALEAAERVRRSRAKAGKDRKAGAP